MTEAPKPFSIKAAVSLLFGIIAIAGGGCFIVPNFIGFICGHSALSAIKKGEARGKTVATIGLILSYTSFAWVPWIITYAAKNPLI